ncbi:MAG: MMPL family transporter [Desulfobacteraceae bacterium]
MDRWIDRLISNHKPVLIVLLLITIPFVYYFSKQTYFNHINVFFPKGDPEIKYYEAFQDKFGNDDVAAIVFKTDDIFTAGNIELIRNITAAIKPFVGVQRVTSLTETEVARGSEDTVDFQKLIPESMPLTPENLASTKAEAIKHPMISGNLLSRDGTTTAIVIELSPSTSNEAKRNLLNGIRDKAETIANGAVKLHYSGGPYLEVEISGLTQDDNKKFTPITFFIIIAVVYFMLRNFTLSILGQLNIAVIVIWGIGFLIMCGESINSVTVVIAPILLAISISDSIHILSYYSDRYMDNGNDHRAAVKDSIRDLWYPCLFTSLTTFAGYLSFVTTTVRPVIVVGIFTAIGVMVAYVLTLVFIPALLMSLKNIVERAFEGKPSQAEAPKQDRFQNAVNLHAEKVVAYPKTICVFFLVFTAIATYGMTKLRFETDFVSYLKENNTIKQDIRFIEKNIRGTVPVELVIKATSPEWDFSHPESLKRLEDVQRDIMSYEKGRFSTSFSVTDYIKEIHGAFTGGDSTSAAIPGSRDDVLDYFELGDEAIFKRSISRDRMEARVSFASKFGSSKNSARFTTYLDDHVRPMLGDRYKLHFTGLSALYITMDRNLMVSQIRSFASALVVIIIMMFFVCRNVKLTLISLPPNLFPILVTLGIMGWFNLPLDAATIMIASVTIGLAVDDTIHFITWFRRNRESGMDTTESVLQSFRDAGKPIVMTSVVLCLSYLVLITASVKPIIAFGALASLAMFFALLGDLFILPALILIFKPDIKPSHIFSEESEVESEGDPALAEALE